jgi:hypothetical protein
MTRVERVRYEVLLRVKDFGIKHRDRFPELSKAGQVFARVAQAVADIEAHMLASLQAVRDGRKGKTAARARVQEWMLTIARTARDVVRRGPGGDTTFKMPRRTSDVSLLASARLFLDDTRPMSEELIALGLPENWQGEFSLAIDGFEEQMRGRRDGRYGVATARTGIKTALNEGFDALRTLDVIVANTLKDDAPLLAGWERSRRVVEGRSKPDADATSPPAAPAEGGQMLDKAS